MLTLGSRMHARQDNLISFQSRMSRSVSFQLLFVTVSWVTIPALTGLAQSPESTIQSLISPGDTALDLSIKIHDTQANKLPSQPANPGLSFNYHPKRFLVRFARHCDGPQRQLIHKSIGYVKNLRNYRACAGLCLVEVDVADYNKALSSYQRHVDVTYAEADTVIQLSALPNDPLFDQLWGMQNTGQTINGTPGLPGADIGASHGWEQWTGDPNYRIAIIDTGIDYTHVDLAANIWTNPDEIPNNGIDDDGNGYVDDIHGYDVVNEDGDPFDDNGHGTHIAGSIGAVGDNNIGVTGLNWRCQLVAIKAFGSDGRGFVSDAIEALEYVIANNINLSNNSYGFNTHSQSLSDTIAASQLIDHLFVTAAGNDVGRNIDDRLVFPASYNLDNILVATATENLDVLSIVSNVGLVSVDVGAPGQLILSTFPGNNYAFLTGTSMACAYTTGLAALLRSKEPDLEAVNIKEQIISTTRPLASLQGRIMSGGIIDAAAALGDCNRNGLLDSSEIFAGASDCNQNDRLDICEADCDLDGLIDECAISQNFDTDCNQNNLPDSCDLAENSNLDCDANQILDVCEIMASADNDINMNGVLDVCESCLTEVDCINSNPCMRMECLDNFCVSTALDNVACDDNNMCSENDMCNAGECAGELILSSSCGPLFTTVLSSLNGQFLPGGSQNFITAARGDELIIEFFGQRWSPRSIVAYNLLVDPIGYTSGTTGRIGPDLAGDVVLGAFINENRADYIFSGFAHISVLFNDTINFLEYIGLLIVENDCTFDDNAPSYLGSLTVRVSDTASGTFRICPQETSNSLPITFLLECESLFTIAPSEIQCVTVDIPLGNCDRTPDCNSNGTWDVCDIAMGTSLDCNRNDVPDECDLTSDSSFDCNNNDIPDECDIASDIETDCDANIIPDSCEPDCNGNGMTDACDILDGLAFDCNGNGTLDVCDIANESSRDCFDRGNGIPDECEADCNENGEADTCDLALGASIDRDANTIPDECQSSLLVPADFPTIAEAINAAVSGDVIVLAPGTYGGNGNLFLDFGGKILTVQCEGRREDCIIDCDGERFAFALRDDETTLSRIERLTMRNCGAAVSMERGASVTISDCVIENSFGAAIFGSRSKAIVEDCLITGSTGFAAINFVTSEPTILRTQIVANQGRAFFSDVCTVELHSCTMADNGQLNGGGIFARRSQYTIDHCTVANNFGNGAPALFASDSQVSITNSVIWNNIETSQPGEVSESDAVCMNLLCPNEPTIVVINKTQLTISDTLIDGGVSSIVSDDSSILSFEQGLIDASPRFVKASRRDDVFAELEFNDYHLSANSPCINTGQRLFLAEYPDVDLETRVLFSRTDLGSDEATSFADCNGNGNPDGQDIVTGRSADCNTNGWPDSCDVLLGRSLDDDGNGTPDECEMGLTVLAGSRHLELNMDNSNVLVALRINTAELEALGCDNTFVGASNEMQDLPFYKTPQAWASVIVNGPTVQSNTNYTIELWTLIDELPKTILTQQVRTGPMGDVNSDGLVNVRDLFDIQKIKATSWDEKTLARFDLAPCLADGIIDNDDITVVRLGFMSEIDAALPPCVADCP